MFCPMQQSATEQAIHSTVATEGSPASWGQHVINVEMKIKKNVKKRKKRGEN